MDIINKQLVIFRGIELLMNDKNNTITSLI